MPMFYWVAALKMSAVPIPETLTEVLLACGFLDVIQASWWEALHGYCACDLRALYALNRSIMTARLGLLRESCVPQRPLRFDPCLNRRGC